MNQIEAASSAIRKRLELVADAVCQPHRSIGAVRLPCLCLHEDVFVEAGTSRMYAEEVLWAYRSRSGLEAKTGRTI
jgi:hypothetical protein